ncbi:ABC transporter ATP-binding protein [Mucilaginibacter sp.]|uniref:ABC transporter ATP-binding protein n=1 Tax=Mucilaginibacter sp. TaxID=1882438 RepID=UPI002625E28A|nr:ABC transporter ATP-binding protein [Mucilaginibacter sp.]MDB4919620.1 ATP-binding cassette protein [Mucilaginibacter sp.]
MAAVIKVENLSKAYQLGDIGTGTISRDLERFWAKMRGKEDPFLKIGEVNDRAVKGVSDIVWSLKDINFEIEQGDAVGIIGRNGAGKSTLLKILSRVTAPTTGSAKLKGRVASLLEVGTGFHPELSGRENIYLNGAILGMRKAEIKKKFDEIVDFSGVDRYIDTPLKRYSSGMYVRLAFAVAAHLESEIMIVDEVLAVGDAEFQKKCLGKMGDVSNKEGRTVLFVSHNTVALSNVCHSGILLQNGEMALSSDINTTINYYLRSGKSLTNHNYSWQNDDGLIAGVFEFKSIRLKKLEEDQVGPEVITLDNSMQVDIDFLILGGGHEITIGIEVFTSDRVCVFKLASDSVKQIGNYAASLLIPRHLLNDDTYVIDVYAIKSRSTILAGYKGILQFDISEVKRDENWYSKWIGVVRPQIPINIKQS